jgi:hypothetical protein
MTTLVFTTQAFHFARYKPGKWWRTVTQPEHAPETDDIHSLSGGDVTCYWTSECDQSSALIVISCPEVFTQTSDRNAITAQQELRR